MTNLSLLLRFSPRTGDCPAERKAKACYKCGDEGHLSRECPQNPAGAYGAGAGGYGGGQQCYKVRFLSFGKVEVKSLTLFFEQQCNQIGHISRNCPQNVGQYGAPGGYGQGGYGGGFGGGFQQQARNCYT
ncbi:hypothetical protein BCR35DRAFT_300851 [Leucosporidium creatinivorum]|uniref:CCHC-type domain-containing protein n=1 Tax=Leucosporidium creatinivorum TaxID=106004 RepID=A0A1Y2FYE7_9BASI|nr:hypothetical protein BCR35DRAFT_300851 [Leucosporidium creatinivorum]